MPDSLTHAFASLEIATYWRYISSSLDRLMNVLADCNADQLNWTPPAPDTNSVYALAVHTLANTRENILGTLCGCHITRDRDAEFKAIANENSVPMHDWPTMRAELERALSVLESETLTSTINHPRRGALTGRDVLIIVVRHSAEHLSQAELTRDLAHATLGCQK